MLRIPVRITCVVSVEQFPAGMTVLTMQVIIQ